MPIDFHDAANSNTYAGRRVAADWVESMSDVAIRGQSVADVGCGGGIYCVALADMGARHVYGVDFSTVMVGKARQVCSGREEITIHRGDAYDLPLEDCSVGVVLEKALTHHLDDLQRNFSEVHRVLEGGGTLVVQNRTMEDVLEPGSDQHLRGIFVEEFPKLAELERSRRASSDRVIDELTGSGFHGAAHSTFYETRKSYASMEDLAGEVRSRRGRSLLHALTDGELEDLVIALEARITRWPVVERDRWSMWRGQK